MALMWHHCIWKLCRTSRAINSAHGPLHKHAYWFHRNFIHTASVLWVAIESRGLCHHLGCLSDILNINLVKACPSITFVSVGQSFWNFAHSTTVILSCSVQNFKTIGQPKLMLWTNKILRDFSLRLVWVGYPSYFAHTPGLLGFPLKHLDPTSEPHASLHPAFTDHILQDSNKKTKHSLKT